MEKIYHVFVSSTYKDLINERKKVSEAVAKAGHVAEGMEIFPASSQSQMTFIERVIDRCDYYILILGGRYGSVDQDGVSYTQREFEYAVRKNIPVLAFLHSDVTSLDDDYIDDNPVLLEKLEKFKNKLTESSLVDFWLNGDELATKALAALSHALQSHPGVGWMRADKVAGSDLLNEMNELRKRNDLMSNQLADYEPQETFKDFNPADLDEHFLIRYTAQMRGYDTKQRTIEIPWTDILRVIGPQYRTATTVSGIGYNLNAYIRELTGISDKASIKLNMHDKQRILMHFEMIGLMSAQSLALKGGGSAIFHTLTKSGTRKMLEANVIPSKK